ncbi:MULTISPECIES: HupE/UreJ family protein [Flavobacterium]|uniref:HupE/UreJ family protein n=1 Tax=Flavobacterium suzhouense TaxID=1529638 RepID=A0ABW5NVT2_9FLAO|nr:HupE/UreJ family protein [Flavobacterium sp. AG291]RDI06764.1 HupE/UreJ protein [Flavobacterium sp. AG291]
MSDFWLYFETGLRHVLDINAYDHILFLVVLTVPYTFKDWKNVLLLVSIFTIGHTLSLMLSVYGVVRVNAGVVEFLIPITILITALFNIIKSGKKSQKNSNSLNFIAIVTLFFGLIHGLGFSNYFKLILDKNADDKFLPLLEFALGIEAAQLIIVLCVLILAYILSEFFKLNRRDWVLVTSAFVAGVVVPMIIHNKFW